MNFLAIMQVLMEVAAAAPGIESSVEEAVASWGAATNNQAKAQAVATAVGQLSAATAKLVPAS